MKKPITGKKTTIKDSRPPKHQSTFPIVGIGASAAIKPEVRINRTMRPVSGTMMT